MRSIRLTHAFTLALIFLVSFAVVQAGPSGNNCGGGDGGSSIDSMQVFACSSGQNVAGSDGGTIAVELTATPSTINQGQSSTLSWVSSGANGCSIISAVEGQTGNPTSVLEYGAPSGNISVSPPETTNYAVICNSGYGAIGGDQAVVTVNAGSPDLTVSASGATQSGTTLQGTITGTVSNTGPASTGASFATVTDIDNDATHSAVYTTLSRTTSTLAGGAQANVDVSYTFANYGTWYYRTCTDTGAVISESNESNNCSSWQTITVSPPPIADIVAGTVNFARNPNILGGILQAYISNTGTAASNQ